MQSEDDADVVAEVDDDVDVVVQVIDDDDDVVDDDVDVVCQVGCWQDKTLVPSRPTLTASLTFCPHLNGSVSESVPSPPFLSYNVNLTF